ncbi:MAG: hypothetical protein KJ955_01795 [Nanoarchaeota archaeon]|nr:hypothetical protein [Nanoarchaeota archaeon]
MAKKKEAVKGLKIKAVEERKEAAKKAFNVNAVKAFAQEKKNRKYIWIAGLLIIIALLASYFPRGTLEITSTKGFDTVGNVEVWIWDKNDFEGKPEKVYKTNDEGIARIKLFRGKYAVALQQELNPKNDPPVKIITFLEIKRGKTLSISMAA